VPSNLQITAPPPVLTLDDVLRLAQATASAYTEAKFAERIAEEDVRQARAAFLPRIAGQPSFIYTSPSSAPVTPGTPRTFSFIGANAITEYQGVAGAIGEVDLAGRLRASLRRNRALLLAARAGTEIERRNLLLATVESYYGLAATVARRSAAELNLNAASEFERITALLEQGGEVAQVDLIRARLATTARRDELEQARAAESIAIEALRVLIGYDSAQVVAVPELSIEEPDQAEIDRYTTQMIAGRPELAQFDAQRTALAEETKQARAERRPQLSYNIIGGFETDSLHAQPLREHSGVQVTVGLTIPLFDWGASRSRERQAQFRLQSLDSARQLALRNFNQQFAAARLQSLSAAQRIRLSRTGIADAERNLEISIARYRAGEAQIIEVTDAQNTLNAQRAALYQAAFDYRVALAHLKQAAGQAVGQ
jgi:outer membrane protein TolC